MSRPDDEELLEAVYTELRALASRFLQGERRGMTLQTTALAHEAWLKLRDQTRVRIQSREHFLGLAAQAIRRILVDHARRRDAKKRGGGVDCVQLEGEPASAPPAPVDVLKLDAALIKLAALHERQARVVELRFFAGLDVAETARALGVAPRTVEGDWAVARAWLQREVARDA